ncbi:MAG: hypothetical protein LBD59_11555 [Prevotellaceae bacterium]|jgi:hypothetical protein|nr:hypothetical protein [Prevotellaceae bacterium]
MFDLRPAITVETGRAPARQRKTQPRWRRHILRGDARRASLHRSKQYDAIITPPQTFTKINQIILKSQFRQFAPQTNHANQENQENHGSDNRRKQIMPIKKIKKIMVQTTAANIIQLFTKK